MKRPEMSDNSFADPVFDSRRSVRGRANMGRTSHRGRFAFHHLRSRCTSPTSLPSTTGSNHSTGPTKSGVAPTMKFKRYTPLLYIISMTTLHRRTYISSGPTASLAVSGIRFDRQPSKLRAQPAEPRRQSHEADPMFTPTIFRRHVCGQHRSNVPAPTCRALFL